MKKLLILFLCIFISSCAHRPRITFEKQIITTEAEASVPVKIEEPAPSLEIGENLTYAVDWIGVPSGYITLETKEITKIGDRDAYHVIAKALPNKFFRFFYDVEYSVHTYIDTQTLKPLRFYKQRRHKKTMSYETIDFFYPEGKAVWKDSEGNEMKELSLPQNPQDLLSSLYYFRLVKEIKVGEKFPVDIIYNGRSWPSVLMVDKIAGVEISKCAKFKAMLITPLTELATYITGFKSIQTYLSTDKKRVPLIFRMRTKIGSLSGVLMSDSLCKNSN